MASGTRERILETARQQFNQRGYEDVSMRNIADALGISVGNLTYHFAKKEELVQAVVLWQHQSYRKTPPVRSLEALHAYFARLLRHHAENNYYFRNYTQLAQQSPEVYKLQQGVMRDTLKTLQGSFMVLERAGLMAPEELPRQYERLALALRMATLYGDSSQAERLQLIWSLLYPVLTRKGKRAWQNNIAPQLAL